MWYVEPVRPYLVAATLHREWAPDLSAARLYALLRLRAEVFVLEFNRPYRDMDGRDLESTARHFWVESGTVAGLPLACLRLLEEPDGTFRIGRLCTALSVREHGLARRLLEAAFAEVGHSPCVLDTPVRAEGLFAIFGFVPEGEPFSEDGIPYISMRRPGRP